MIVQKRGDVSIYNLTAGPSIPEWITERARRNLSKKDEGIRRRIELIQDFDMPASSSRIRQSEDGRYLLAAGTYPPRVRCFDTNELGLKFERYVAAGVIDLCMLGQDYGKFCLLQEDRTVAFHAPYGAHEAVRIPTFGRAMTYESSTCDLLVAAKGSSVYRINLEEGRFQAPYEIHSDSSSTCLEVHPVHPLLAVGCEDGILRFWDSRRSDQLLPFLKLDVSSAISGSATSYAATHSNEITSISHDSTNSNGMYMAVGTATGMVAVYDIRSSRPLHVYAHKAGQPIHTVQFHNNHVLLSGDESLIQGTTVMTTSSSQIQFHIEASSHFSHFIVANDEATATRNGSTGSSTSGLILCATDQPKMEAFYVPSLGVAPKWCSFLEGITEELQERDLSRESTNLSGEGVEAVYDNYKFVSRNDVDKLGIVHLVGTPLLRGYMHGFFMDQNLYNRVAAIANPFEYEEYQKKKLKERLESKQSSRIAPRNNQRHKSVSAAAVNPDFAERLEAKAAIGGKDAKQILQDNRFGPLFTNPDFEIDQEHEDFKLRNPSGVAAAKRRKDNQDSDEESEAEPSNRLYSKAQATTSIHDEPSEDGNESGDDESDDSDDIGLKGVKVRGEEYDAANVTRRERDTKGRIKRTKKVTAKHVKMYEAEEGNAVGLGLGHQDASQRRRRRLEEMNVPLAKRVTLQQEKHDAVQIRLQGGSKEATYVPQGKKKADTSERLLNPNPIEQSRKRRGVKELGFKGLK